MAGPDVPPGSFAGGFEDRLVFCPAWCLLSRPQLKANKQLPLAHPAGRCLGCKSAECVPLQPGAHGVGGDAHVGLSFCSLVSRVGSQVAGTTCEGRNGPSEIKPPCDSQHKIITARLVTLMFLGDLDIPLMSRGRAAWQT